MRLFLAAFLGLLAAAGAQAQSHTDTLAAHRAIYDLKLQSARGDVVAASGRMAYEVTDACDAWAVRQRLEMTVTNRDGQDVDMVSDYTTWETKDGHKLRFRLHQTTDDTVTADIAGEAVMPHPGAPGTATFTAPQPATKVLPKGTLFPMAHTAALIAAAREGKRFIALPLFDGTSAAGPQDSSIAIAGWDKPVPTKWKGLAGLDSARVHIAFFDTDNASQQPDYEVGMRYWSNGVADDLSMDFGDFVMQGTLSQFSLSKPGC